MGGDGKNVIIFGTYNIQNGRNGGIEYALKVMEQSNVDLGAFQDTKVDNGVHMRALAGYHVLTVDAQIRHQRGIDVFYYDAPHFQVKDYHPRGPNMESLQLVSGGS